MFKVAILLESVIEEMVRSECPTESSPQLRTLSRAAINSGTIQL
jgi:hypothetical protein